MQKTLQNPLFHCLHYSTSKFSARIQFFYILLYPLFKFKNVLKMQILCFLFVIMKYITIACETCMILKIQALDNKNKSSSASALEREKLCKVPHPLTLTLTVFR